MANLQEPTITMACWWQITKKNLLRHVCREVWVPLINVSLACFVINVERGLFGITSDLYLLYVFCSVFQIFKIAK